MKRYLLLSAFVFFAMIAAAQSKSCYGDWGLFQNVNAPGANINFRIAFKQPLTRKEECQYIFYRFENVYPIPGAILRFKVDYLKPDGSTATEKFGYVELARQGIYEPSGNFLLGHQIIRIYDGEFQPPKKEKTNDDNLLPQSGQNRTNNKINTPLPPGTPLKQNPGTRMDGMGSLAENTQPKVETYASTNSNQSMQQVQHQNTANAYLDAAQSSTDEINKALNLNLAAINAQASGNQAQIQQVQQLKQQQSQQQIQQLGNQLTTLVGDLIDRKFERDQREREREAADLEVWRAKVKVDEQRKTNLVNNFENLIPGTRKLIENSRYPAQVLQGLIFLNKLHARLDTLNYRNSWVKTDGDVYYFTTKLEKITGPVADPLTLKYNTNIWESSIYHLDQVNKEKYADKVGEFLIYYYNGLAAVKGDKSKNIPADVNKAATLLKKAERIQLNKDEHLPYELAKLNIIDTTYYSRHEWHPTHSSYISLGFKGIKQMNASVILGDIYADSAAVTGKSAYLVTALLQYDKGIRYYLDNLYAYAQNKKYNKDSEIEIYPEAFHRAYFNMLLAAYKLTIEWNNRTPEDKSYANWALDECLTFYDEYYNPLGDLKDSQKKGSKYLEQGLYNSARVFLQKAAAEGDYIAMVQLGSMYENGLGVPKDFDMAFEWYKKALSKGNTAANFLIRGLTNTLSFKNTKAINFTQKNTQNIPVSLQQFKGKYILLNFWASWNRLDRAENKNLASVYEKYKNQNFTIVSISLDYNKENWLASVAEDKLTWANLSDLKRDKNAVALLYKVESIPANFLIDPTGKIIEVNLIGDDLTAALSQIFK